MDAKPLQDVVRGSLRDRTLPLRCNTGVRGVNLGSGADCVTFSQARVSEWKSSSVFVYIARRIVYVISIVLSVALVCFLLVHITPGDPLVAAILPADASQELAAATPHRLRLRSAAACSVRPLDVAGAARRSRQLHRHRPSCSDGGDESAVSNTATPAIAASPDRLHARVVFGLIAGFFCDTCRSTRSRPRSPSPASPCRIIGSVWCWSSSSRCSSTGCLLLAQVRAARVHGAGTGSTCKYLVLPAITTSVIPMGIVTRTVRALTARYPVAGFRRGACVPRACSETKVFSSRHQECGAHGAGRDGPAARLHARRLDPDRDRVLVARFRGFF